MLTLLKNHSRTDSFDGYKTIVTRSDSGRQPYSPYNLYYAYNVYIRQIATGKVTRVSLQTFTNNVKSFFTAVTSTQFNKWYKANSWSRSALPADVSTYLFGAKATTATSKTAAVAKKNKTSITTKTFASVTVDIYYKSASGASASTVADKLRDLIASLEDALYDVERDN